jgi:hypothetical protein
MKHYRAFHKDGRSGDVYADSLYHAIVAAVALFAAKSMRHVKVMPAKYCYSEMVPA